MKKIICATVVLFAVICCQKQGVEKAPVKPYDYTDASSWLRLDTQPSHEVDLFYILPTMVMSGENDVERFSEMERIESDETYCTQARALSTYTNVYAPYYRQVPFTRAMESTNSEMYYKMVREGGGRDDIYAALDYFFENCNEGRPFILASHSQGSAMMRTVLDDYMRDHMDYYKKMVAAYVIGYALPLSWFKKYPHLKAVQCADDIGVVIGWNSEGPSALKSSMLLSGEDCIINPLSWSKDTGYVSAEMNPGSIIRAEDGTYHIIKGIPDAQVDNNRHVVVVTASDAYDSIPGDLFGEKSLHTHDWSLFYESIRINGKLRCEKFLGHEIEEDEQILN